MCVYIYFYDIYILYIYDIYIYFFFHDIYIYDIYIYIFTHTYISMNIPPSPKTSLKFSFEFHDSDVRFQF